MIFARSSCRFGKPGSWKVGAKSDFAEDSLALVRSHLHLHAGASVTIIFPFHQSKDRNFKAYYTEYVCQHLRSEFPNLVSYEHFVALMPSAFGPLTAYLRSLYGHCHGISFIDSTALSVCNNHKIHNHKVFAGFADRGELLACQVTPASTDDRTPVPELCKRLFGKLIADRGYISQALFEQLLETFNLQLITKLRKNIKNRLVPLMDKLLLRKRAIIESVVDQLKNISQIEHTRHRSPNNAFINIIAGLIAYCHQPKKPSLNLFPIHLLTA